MLDPALNIHGSNPALCSLVSVTPSPTNNPNRNVRYPLQVCQSLLMTTHNSSTNISIEYSGKVIAHNTRADYDS